MNKSEKILVSVIICFLNEEKYIVEAIESVLEQTYTNWQLILVDDGSTDSSSSIARNFARDNSGKIIYLEHSGHSNEGLSASRNLGIKNAEGEWVALLDADDVWTKSKLQEQVEIIVSNPGPSMICEASSYWHSWSSSEKTDKVIYVGENLDGLYLPPVLMKSLYPLGNGAAPCPSGIIFLKKAWERVGGFQEEFKEIYQLYEDQAFLCKIYLNEPVYISRLCNNLYRQREESLVHSVTKQGKYDTVRKYFLHFLKNKIKALPEKDSELEKIFEKALEVYHPKPYSRIKRLLMRILVK